MDVKDILLLERVQRLATKYMTIPHHNYRERLIKLHLLPLAMQLELNVIMFFVRAYSDPLLPLISGISSN